MGSAGSAGHDVQYGPSYWQGPRGLRQAGAGGWESRPLSLRSSPKGISPQSFCKQSVRGRKRALVMSSPAGFPPDHYLPPPTLRPREDEHTRARLGAWALTVPTSPSLLQLQTGTRGSRGSAWAGGPGYLLLMAPRSPDPGRGGGGVQHEKVPQTVPTPVLAPGRCPQGDALGRRGVLTTSTGPHQDKSQVKRAESLWGL